MPRIAGAFVDIRPETLGFRGEAKRAIQQALAAVDASIPLTAEGRGLRAEVRRAATAAAAGAKIDVPVSAQSRGLRGEVSRAIAGAGAGQNVKVGVSVDDRQMRRLLATAAGGAAGLGGALGALVIPPAFLQGISAATAGLVAMAGAAAAVVAPLGQLAGLIPALGVGAIALGAGIGVVAGALSGVGDALKAYSAEQKEAGQAAVSSGRSARAAAQAQEAAAEAVEDATRRLAQAQENQARDAERSAESIASAQQAVADAQEAQVESAERSAESIARAQERVLESQEAVVDAERRVTELREESAERAAEAQERYAERVAESNEDILRAEEDLADRRIELAEDVADAQRRLEEDRLEGQERIAAAEQRVNDVQRRNAQRDRDRRQRDQDRQRLDAARTPEERQRIQAEIDRRRAREEEAEDRERAARDLKDAQDDLAQAQEDAAEREAQNREALADAQQAQAEGIEDAEQRVTDARKAGLEVQKEGQRIARQQVEDERRIAEAVDDVTDARKAEAAAQLDLQRTRTEASRDAVRAERAVADAVGDLARTRRDADRSAADAQRAVADAARDVERAMRRAGEVAEEAGTTGAASVDKFALAMEGLSPAAQSFVRALIGVKDTLKELRDTAAEGLLPGLERGLVNVKPLLDSLHPSISLVAGSLGTFADKLGLLLGGPESLAGFATLGGASADILDRLGRAALILVPPLGQLLVAAVPLATSLADMAVSGAKVFAAFVDGKASAGELAGMFERTESTLRLLGSITGNIGGALRGIFSAALPTGLEYLGLLDQASGKLRDLIRSDAGQSGLRKFFEDSKPLVLELTGLFGDLVQGLGGIGARLAPELTPVIAQIRTELLPVLLSMVDSLDADFLSTLVTATAQIAALIGAFAQPTGALKLILEGLGDFAGLVTTLLTDLGPLSVLLTNMATALAFVGTAVAGIKIARLISDFRGLGAVKAELAGVEAAAAGATAKVGGLGLAAKALGLAGIFIAVKGTIDDLAPSIDKTTQRLLSLPASVKEFEKAVDEAAKPSLWEKIASQAKRNLSLEFFTGLFKPLPAEARKATDEALVQFKALAVASPEFAFNLLDAMRQAGQPTAQFEEIIRSLGLGQRFMADETAKATAKIKEQRDAARDAIGAELDLLDAIERLGTGLAENGAGFDENTAKGRENIRNRESMLTAVERNIEALIRDGEQNGIDAGQVDQLRTRMEELKQKYPELAGQIDTFKNDFNRSLEGIRDREVFLSLRTGVTEENNTNLGTAGDPVQPGGLEKGGRVTRGLPRRGPTDTIPAWLAPEEFVVKASSTRSVGAETLAYINETGKLPGFSVGGYVNPHAAAPGFAAGGLINFKMLLPDIAEAIGAGRDFIEGESSRIAAEAQANLDEQARQQPASAPAPSSSGGGGGGDIGGGTDVGTSYEGILAALDQVGQEYTVTSAYRAGDPGFHGRGKAVDLVGDMSSIFDVIEGFSGINELFFDPKGYFIDEGVRHSGAIGDHDDHVHAATFDGGGILEPGWNRVRNATGAREALVPAAGEEMGELVKVLRAQVGAVEKAVAAMASGHGHPILLKNRDVAEALAADNAKAIDDYRKKRL